MSLLSTFISKSCIVIVWLMVFPILTANAQAETLTPPAMTLQPLEMQPLVGDAEGVQPFLIQRSADVIAPFTTVEAPSTPVETEKPFVFPEPAPIRPVAIPFPTAAHLFVPGALLALYATRRYRRRR